MSYFPNAFDQILIGGDFVTTGRTEDLIAGQFGFFDPKTWAAVPVANATVTAHPSVVLATGNYHTVDRIGSHGGYKESIKSKVIYPGRIHRVWKTILNGATSQFLFVGYDNNDPSTAPRFYCGQTYELRVDLKGTPMMHLLGHDLSRRFSVSTGCCADPDNPVAVDPFVVLLDFANQINNDPVYGKFIYAGVNLADPDNYVPLTNQADIDAAMAILVMNTGFMDTVFGNCSFDPRDYFEAEPVIITAVQLVDDSGGGCPPFKQLVFTELEPGKMADGGNERPIRELALYNNYRQEPYQFDARRRDAVDMDTMFTQTTPSPEDLSFYFYYILYSVDRKSNPTGIYDKDLYLLKLCVAKIASAQSVESWLNSYLSSSGTGVVIEDMTV
jgi:hypothetical protein